MSNLKATKYQSIFKYFQNIFKKKIENKKTLFFKIFSVFQIALVANFVKTLKIRVKLILNCPQAHAITYTKSENEQFDHIFFYIDHFTIFIPRVMKDENFVEFPRNSRVLIG